MSRRYTVSWTGTLTAAGGDADLFELVPATQKGIRLRGLILSQISEVGDAAEEGLRISILRLPATLTSGSGGSSGTAIPVDEGNTVAAGFTAETNNTTVATTSGTAALLEDLGWNIRQSPLERWWPDEEWAPQVRNAGGLVVRSQTTPADDITVVCTAFVDEF